MYGFDSYIFQKLNSLVTHFGVCAPRLALGTLSTKRSKENHTDEKSFNVRGENCEENQKIT